MAIKDVGKFKCNHKVTHKTVKVLNCEWCKEDFQRPSCWPKEAKFCSSWCARRQYAKLYSGIDSPNFKHGITNNGYKRINKNGKRMLEHRAVMEDKLGRDLKSSEWVHHKNGDNLDNSPENLAVVLVNHHFTDVSCPNCQFNFLIK